MFCADSGVPDGRRARSRSPGSRPVECVSSRRLLPHSVALHRLCGGGRPRRGRPSGGRVDGDRPGRRRMKWVTREHVKVDRVACPWLIMKFVDPDAEFLFVPKEQVAEVAKREDAIPY